jgi:hypothetical protein
VIDLSIHNMRHLRETGQLDTATQEEMSSVILAQLGFLMNIRDMQEKSIFWALRDPPSFLMITRQVKEPRTVEQLLVKARDSGVDLAPLREFPGFPPDLR